ncbi:50S ribosomal protein L18 [Candidatus Parcubacteria bacterium]|nr:50S ribosomal protein L18 [Candidatus Parcubacteria bacterium]
MNNKTSIKTTRRDRRRGKIRSKISGTSIRPRLSVFRSNAGMFIQLIDDAKGTTIIGVNMKEIKKGTKMEKAFEMGKVIAKKALKQKIESVVFDRGGYNYHGRVKAVADGAREAGLKF